MAMLTSTHIVFAVTTYYAFGENSPAGVALAATSALLPDLDTRQSLIGKILPFLSAPISYHLGHRTFTHSLLFQLLMSGAVIVTLPASYGAAILCGLVSHTFADMLTLSGVCWFWPSRIRCVLPGSSKYRFETGSWAELAFASTMAALSFLLVWMNNSSVGTAGVIRAAIGDIGAARKQYDEQKGSFEFVLRLKGRNNESLAAVDDEYPVIAQWAGSGFLIKMKDRPVSVCRRESCLIYPEHTVLVAKSSAQTTTLIIEEKSLPVSELKRVIQSYQQFGSVYLRGSYRGLSTPDGLTVKFDAGKTSLYYAESNALPDAGRLHDIKLRLQIQHGAGVRLPSLPRFTQAPDLKIIDPLLKKWL